MATDVWFDRLGEALGGAGIATYAAPLSGTSTNGIMIRPFGPYDAGGGNWQFSKGLHFEMPNASPFDSLFAMTTGSVSYLAGTDGAPGKIVLLRGDAMPTAQVRQTGSLPAWFPQPKVIIYENVDSGEARSAILAVFGDEIVAEGVRVRLRKEMHNPDFNPTPDELADLWMQNIGPHGGVPVSGGTKIGACGISTTAATLEATVKMFQALNLQTICFNPSYYLSLWASQGWIAGGNSLLEQQSNVIGPVAASGRIVFVKQTGSGVLPFTTPATASPTIGPAIAAALPQDTVLILDAGTYQEDEIVITKPITLMSSSRNKATDASPQFPTIDPDKDHRAIRISNVATGIAHISHLSIVNGAAKHHVQNGAGGGVLVESTENAVITACTVRDCNAFGGGIMAEGYGGGIGSYHSSPAIVGCLLERNHGAGRGSGIGAWGYGWPTVFDCTLRGNIPPSKSDLPQLPDPIFDPLGRNLRGDGGGIAITIAVPNTEDLWVLKDTTVEALPTRWDQANLLRARNNWARIQGCTINGNQAADDGGGIFVSIAANVRVTDCIVTNNKAANNGGGIRVTMRSELVVIRGNVSNNQSNFDSDVKTKAGGGGVSSRNSTNVQLRNVMIDHNHAFGFSGGGVSFISTDEGDLTTDWHGFTPPPFDWNDILLHPQIFAFDSAVLQINQATVIRSNEATFIEGQTANHGKGGALYGLRFNGPRFATRVSPTILGQPVHIHVNSVASLETTNTASFAGTKRIFTEDQFFVPEPRIKKDADLPASGFFSYPED